MIEADTGRLRQLMHNLIKNAIEAMNAASSKKIMIRTRCMDESGCRFVELQVRDYGLGFPDEAIGQYFEPYMTTKKKGTGLGLAIVKKIVEEHGGMVWAENAPEEGAQIIVRLPVITTEKQIAQMPEVDRRQA
jgi:nitrogen fixation/metabolism regulation signal transduction histidine kinase